MAGLMWCMVCYIMNSFDHMHLVVAARAVGIKAFAFFDPSAGMV
jgi:hypothetical protein